MRFLKTSKANSSPSSAPEVNSRTASRRNGEVKIGQIVERLEAHSVRMDGEVKAEANALVKAEKQVSPVRRGGRGRTWRRA